MQINGEQSCKHYQIFLFENMIYRYLSKHLYIFTNPWVYLLFEHKSRINADVSYQILRYMMQIWEEYRKQSRRNLKHPLVISIVLYHGYKPWKRCNTVKDITEILTDAEDYVPEFRAKVFDVSELCETQLGKVSFYTRVFLISLRYSYHPEKWEILPELIQLYRKATGKQREYLSVSFKYILGLMNGWQKKQFFVNSRSYDGGDELMRSIADVLRDEGVKIGVGKGIKIGEEIGEKRGEKKVHSENEMRDAKMVIKMYQKGISKKDIHEITGISMQKIRKILKSE